MVSYHYKLMVLPPSAPPNKLHHNPDLSKKGVL